MSRTLLVTLLLVIAATTVYAQQYGRIKVINAYPFNTETALDLFVMKDGFVVYSTRNLAYLDASEWFYLMYDVYDFQIRPSGGNENFTSGTLIVNQLSYVFVAYSDTGIVLGTIADDITPILPGKARVTVSHVAFGFPNVDVGAGVETASLASNLVYSGVSAPTLGTPGTGFFDVRGAGSSGPPDISKSVTLYGQKSYLVLLVGYNDASGPLPTIVLYELTDYSIEARLSFVVALPAENLGFNLVADGSFYLFRNIRYTNITNYLNIPAGARNLAVTVNSNTLISVSVFLNGFTESTFFAATTQNTAFGRIVSDYNTAPSTGKARVRIMHAGITSAVDVYLNGVSMVSYLNYGLATGYAELPAGAYTGAINYAGTQTRILSINLNIPSGAVITVIASGVPNTDGITTFIVFPSVDALYGSNGAFRAFHALATFSAPTVNVKIDNLPFVYNMSYANFTVYGQVAPGLHQVSVHSALTDEELFRSPIRVNAENFVTALIGGDQNPSIMQLNDVITKPASGNAHIRGVHASATSPEINLQIGGQTVAALIYPEMFGYTPVNASIPLATRITKKSDNSVLFDGTLSDDADTVVSYFAVGILGDLNRGFMLVRTLDFDFRTPMAPVTPPAAPVATPTKTPSKAPGSRVSSAADVTVGVVTLMAFAIVLLNW